jgi:hypothetical protein
MDESVQPDGRHWYLCSDTAYCEQRLSGHSSAPPPPGGAERSPAVAVQDAAFVAREEVPGVRS